MTITQVRSYTYQSCPRSDSPAGRVGSGRVGSGRVGSALRIFYFFTDYFLVPESNTTFGLIDFLRYLIYNN